MIKKTYLAGVRSVPFVWDKAGAIAARVPHRHGWRKWFASLGAIYDLDAMLPLDIPWWNVAATRRIERFLSQRPAARVFEYGSGASTLWLARRAASVLSVEHDGAWAQRVGTSLAAQTNVTMLHRPLVAETTPADQPYVRAIEEQGQFDLIVVDGRQRSACLRAALPHLAEDGIIVFDDSGRRRYRAAIEACGLQETRLRGLSYCVPYPDNTSLLSRAPLSA
ncbi:class I SAM-dependent methyltransferase [Novosphingobium mangrovi (ex Hu et al. 2023)]|uniref:Class I SAM-dependent methyltransferase n=1 Tax=Novosphingobium mangrovi (ex Hu et al. 2023) TaxID=2930094 RepID=A0ABT0AG38_9SPHN|nr:class I SAM-dependent methyltransferase [Novosphingobium mangrovi (ex Hu et al. 2023)]MCJ1962153.1 class I SAM-dependent methyltransferase [Novosphingobium mangrovi (ex Hu et al. 2023)]